MEKLYYNYETFLKDLKTLLPKIKNFNPEVVLSISRGGVIFGYYIANCLDNRNLFTLNAISYEKTQQLDDVKIFNIPSLENFKRILIVDDISDSGKTLKKILEILEKKYQSATFKTATLFYNEKSLVKPDFFANISTKWIDFFWEVDAC